MANVTKEDVVEFIEKMTILELSDFVKDLESGKNQPLSRWTEKTGDIINYMILMEALNIERRQSETNSS